MIQPQVQTIGSLGGIQTQKSLTNFALRDALSAIGGYFDVSGAYVKRKGGEKYNTTALASGLGLYDFRYSNDTTSKILIAAGTNMYEGNGGSPSSIKSGLTSGNFYDFETYDDRAWWVNKADAMYKYDGTTVTLAGIDSPSTSPSGAGSAAGGTLTASGVYKVAVTYASAYQESNPDDGITVTLGGGDNRIALTSVPVSADTQVTKRNIYLSTNGGSVLAFQGTIADNSTTTYNITAEATGAALAYDNDDPPSGLQGFEQFKNRFIAYKNDTVYIGKAFTPGSFPHGEFGDEFDWTTPVGNSSPITGMKTALYEQVFIFKRDEVWVMTGNDENDFTFDRVKSDERVGCISDRTIRVIGNWVYFVGENSVYRTNGVEIQDIGHPIGDFFNQNSTDATYKIVKSQLPSACTEYVKELNTYFVFVAVDSGTTNNMCFAMDTNSVRTDKQIGKVTADWSIWPGFTTQAVARIRESGTDRWFRMDNSGYVFRQDQLDGDGSNVTSTATSGGASTLTDSAQSWTVDLYAGLRVNILSGTGAGQERTISSNTATQLTVGVAWTTTPDSTSVYAIGGIPYSYQHGFSDYGMPSHSKRWMFARPRIETNGVFDVNAYAYFDFATADSDLVETTLSIPNIAFWDSALWDVGSWDGIAIYQSKYRLPTNRIHRWSAFKIENNAAGQNVRYVGLDKIFQVKGIR